MNDLLIFGGRLLGLLFRVGAAGRGALACAALAGGGSAFACFLALRLGSGGLLRRAATGLFLFRGVVRSSFFRSGALAGAADGLFFSGGRLFFGSGGLSGAAGFCGFDFFVILFGKNGVLTHVILKKCDTASALQSVECDPYARACKRKQGVAPGGKWAGIGDDGASDALYSC